MTDNLSMDSIRERFIAWASAQTDIRAAAVVGSQARTDRPADEWSDLDLLVITVNPESYLTSTAWLAQIAPPLITFVEQTTVGQFMERRVLFDGSYDVDFSFVSAAAVQQLAVQGVPDDAGAVLRRGFKLLFDKDGWLTRFLAAARELPERPASIPTPLAFTETVHDYLYHTMWTAKKVRRGEIWFAKMCVDWHLKERLLDMIEWNAQAEHGWRYETWYGGRFLERWAAPEVTQALPATFATYCPRDIRRALLSGMELFRSLAVPVARQLRADYPEAAHAHVTSWIEQHLAE